MKAFLADVVDLAGEEPVEPSVGWVGVAQVVGGAGVPAAGQEPGQVGVFGAGLHDFHLPAFGLGDLLPRKHPFLVAAEQDHGPLQPVQLPGEPLDVVR